MSRRGSPGGLKIKLRCGRHAGQSNPQIPNRLISDRLSLVAIGRAREIQTASLISRWSAGKCRTRPIRRGTKIRRKFGSPGLSNAQFGRRMVFSDRENAGKRPDFWPAFVSKYDMAWDGWRRDKDSNRQYGFIKATTESGSGESEPRTARPRTIFGRLLFSASKIPANIRLFLTKSLKKGHLEDRPRLRGGPERVQTADRLMEIGL